MNESSAHSQRKQIGFRCIKSYQANMDWYFKKGDFCRAEQCAKLPQFWEPVYEEVQTIANRAQSGGEEISIPEEVIATLWNSEKLVFGHGLAGSYRLGAIAMYRRLSTHPPVVEGGLKWVKAIERMPIDKHFHPIKIVDGKIPMYSIGHLTISGDFWDDWHGNAYPPDQIEWLDKSPEPPTGVLPEVKDDLDNHALWQAAGAVIELREKKELKEMRTFITKIATANWANGMLQDAARNIIAKYPPATPSPNSPEQDAPLNDQK